MPDCLMPSTSQHADGTESETIVLRRGEIDLANDYAAPIGKTETRLAEIWQQVLRLDRVGRNDNFFELGGDSLQAFDVLSRVEKELGLSFSPSALIDHPTIAEFSPLLSTAAFGDARFVVPLQPEGADPPLFLLHELGGNLFCYRQLVLRLGTARKIYGIEYPGQDRDPIPHLSIPEMAEIYVGAIKKIQPEGPYFLAGFSFGGMAAYEVARQLQASGDHVGMLVLLDALNRDGLVEGVQRKVLKLSQHLANLSEEDVSAWPRYFINALRKEARGKLAVHNSTAVPPPALAEKMAGPLPEKIRQLTLDTLMSAATSYDVPPYDGEVKLFRTNSHATRWSRRHLGWRGRARAIEVINFHGDHGAVINPPHVGVVAEYLNIWMHQALE